MGVYWGSKFLAVTGRKNMSFNGNAEMLIAELDNCFVVQSDLKPSPSQIVSNERTFLPIPEQIKCLSHAVFDDIEKAEIAVREHILSVTQDAVVQLTVCLELTKLEIEEAKLLKSPLDSKAKDAAADSVVRLQQQIKAIRQIRKAKIKHK